MTALSEAWAALANLRQTTLGFQAARTANPNAWLQTRNAKVEQYLVKRVNELGGSATVTPPPPPAPAPAPPTPVVDPRSQYVLFAAQEPEKALAAPAKYAVALSADPAYRDASIAAIPKLRAAGHRVAGWCDCRVEGGTPAADGIAFVNEYELDYFIGQAESSAEFDDAYSHGSRVIIGNRSSLRADQAARLSVDVAFIQERYWNEGWATDPSPDIAAYCNGIYPTAIWNPTIQQYKDSGRWRAGDGLYHVAAVEDWQNLP